MVWSDTLVALGTGICVWITLEDICRLYRMEYVESVLLSGPNPWTSRLGDGYWLACGQFYFDLGTCGHGVSHKTRWRLQRECG